MSEMLEKVAEAIWADAGFAKLHPEGLAGRPQYVREHYLRAAAAAVRALREPDDDMLDKMNDLAIDGPGYVSFYPSLHDCGELWKQGIDSILSTPTTRGEVK